MSPKGRCPCLPLVAMATVAPIGCARSPLGPAEIPELVIGVVSDMRNFTAPEYPGDDYFAGAVEAMRRAGPPDLVASPGDIDPPDRVYDALEQGLGNDVPWYPVVGNHETETVTDMQWLRQYNAGPDTLPNVVRTGPAGSEETTYAFEWGDAHFAVLNQYYDGISDIATNGDIGDVLYDWLAVDLGQTDRPFVFVLGHEPMVSVADMDTGRERHVGDSLDAYPANRDRFARLLADSEVTAYICGHTHNASIVDVQGTTQLDAGHARGRGDTGSPSTFLLLELFGGAARVVFWRDQGDGYERRADHTFSPRAGPGP